MSERSYHGATFRSRTYKTGITICDIHKYKQVQQCWGWFFFFFGSLRSHVAKIADECLSVLTGFCGCSRFGIWPGLSLTTCVCPALLTYRLCRFIARTSIERENMAACSQAPCGARDNIYLFTHVHSWSCFV